MGKWEIDRPVRQPYVDDGEINTEIDWHATLRRTEGVNRMSSFMDIQFSSNSGIRKKDAEEIVRLMLAGLNAEVPA